MIIADKRGLGFVACQWHPIGFEIRRENDMLGQDDGIVAKKGHGAHRMT